MKRLVTTLAILLIVIVVGLSALVLLIDPNDFKQYMIKQVASRSGYQLKLDGELRWHVWPRLSILGGQMSLTAPGAKAVAVRADNIRLDVHLWPLLRHRLLVDQILLDNAVLRLVPESQANTPVGSPIAPDQSNDTDAHRAWSLDVNYLKLVNSLIIWQDPEGKLINFRNINLELTQPHAKQAQFVFSGTLSRNQQQLALQMSGQLDARHYPMQLVLKDMNTHYQLSGLNLPAEGMAGQFQLEGTLIPNAQQFDFKQFTANINQTELTGHLSGQLGPSPMINGQLNAQHMDLDSWSQFISRALAQHDFASTSSETETPVAVINRGLLNDHWMRKMRYDLHLHAEQATWQDEGLNQLDLVAEQVNNSITISRFEGRLADGGGRFSLPMQINWQSPTPLIKVNAVLTDMAMTPLLKLAQLPQTVQGRLSLQGQFEGTSLGIQSVLTHWNGQAAVKLADFSTSPFDLKTLFTNSIEHNHPGLKSPITPNTQMPTLTGDMSLAEGRLDLHHVSGQNEKSEFDTTGQINLHNKTLDLTLNLKMKGWQGDESLTKFMNNHSLPLRLYGDWDNINYSLSLDKILDADSKAELRQRLQQWSKQAATQRASEGTHP